MGVRDEEIEEAEEVKEDEVDEEDEREPGRTRTFSIL
jgi:hypothetical protein